MCEWAQAANAQLSDVQQKHADLRDALAEMEGKLAVQRVSSHNAGAQKVEQQHVCRELVY